MQIGMKSPLVLKVKTVLVDGIDVTKRCFYVDDEAGEAHCFKVDGNNKFYFDNASNKAAKEILRGKVEIIFKEESN
jgi:hypothetical protein